MEEEMVNVYEDGEVIAIIKVNRDLDCGLNISGIHTGLARLADGRYVLIKSSDWQGDEDHAYIITEEEAFDFIVRSQNYHLFADPRFVELKSRFEELLNKEMK